MKRFILAVVIVSVIWLVFPIPAYGIFVRFFGLVPPAGFRGLDLVFMIPTSILGGFIFVLIFMMIAGITSGLGHLINGIITERLSK